MAVMEAPPRRMTLEEFLDLPEGPPFYEREPDGEVIEMPSARSGHNRLVGRLFGLLDTYVHAQDVGTVDMTLDVVFPSGRVYTPDLSYLGPERIGLLAEDGKIHGVPTMVAELISPGGQTRDRVDKFEAYKEEGVEWYWLIESTTLDVEEYHLESGRYVCTARHARGQVFHPQVFPGFAIDLQSLLPE